MTKEFALFLWVWYGAFFVAGYTQWTDNCSRVSHLLDGVCVSLAFGTATLALLYAAYKTWVLWL